MNPAEKKGCEHFQIAQQPEAGSKGRIVKPICNLTSDRCDYIGPTSDCPTLRRAQLGATSSTPR